MDVVRLGAVYTSVYVPDDLIEGYSSMIWTERHQTFGEFELRTPLIDETLKALPEDTLISHLDTKDVMIVENRRITRDAEGNKELTVTGRTLDCFLEHRFVEGPFQKKRKMAKSYTPTAAAAVLLVNAVDNASGKDITREGDYSWPTLDRIPNVTVTDSVPTDGTARRWRLEQGMLYPQLVNILIAGDIGIRMIRPYEGSSGQVISVGTALEERGEVYRVSTNPITSLRFDIYEGLDRSHEQTDRPVVGFNYLQGHLDSEEYLFSSKEFKTVVEIISSIGGADVYRNSTEQAYSGLRRRVMAYDGGTLELPDPPEPPPDLRSNATKTEIANRAKKIDKWLDDFAAWGNNNEQLTAEFLEDNQADSQRQLKKSRRLSLFNGSISPLAPYKFKTHYNLGDKVTLYGDYDQVEKMIVSEYVRTEDANGDRGYPGLTTA